MMKKTGLYIGVAVCGMLLSGCAQPAPATSQANDKECATLNKKITQTEKFYNEIAAMDQSHVEEYVAALPRTEISTSTNKSRILKDTKLHKAALENTFQTSGCTSGE